MPRLGLHLALLLAGCSATPSPAVETASGVAAERMPAVDLAPAATPVAVAETWVPPQSCVRPWPSSPADPGVGVYGSLRNDLASYLVYDGETVVLRWLGARPEEGVTCPLPFRARTSPRGLVRFRARRRGDALQARVDCYGWLDVARFLDANRVEVIRSGLVLFRIRPSMMASCRRQRWLMCSPTYEPAERVESLADPPVEYEAPYLPSPDEAGLPPYDECSLTASRATGREGFYATNPFDGYPDRADGPRLTYALFDGRSLVIRYNPATRAHGQCREGSPDDLAAGIHRFEARVNGDALEARLPCEGWRTVGRFEGMPLRLEGVPDLLFPDGIATCESIPYSLCRPIYAPSRDAPSGDTASSGP